MHYQVYLLKDKQRSGSAKLLDHCSETLTEKLNDQGITLYGTFANLFGLASNEIYFVTAARNKDVDLSFEFSEFAVIERTDLIPTVRPTDHTTRATDGLYVFRWFTVLQNNVAEIVELSQQAWVTFESGFDTEVQGLFTEEDPKTAQCKMLLITWYSDLATWQKSRQPPPKARENFLRRHQLTLEARPIATRLANKNLKSDLISNS